MKPLWNATLETREKNLKSVETWLGDDHNLAVLLETHPHEGLKSKVDEYRKELENSALELSRSLYAEKPKVFVSHIEQLWTRGRHRPSSRRRLRRRARNAVPPDEREWLETNGIGGYACGTVSGIHTRRYHGLLTTSDHQLLLSKIARPELNE